MTNSIPRLTYSNPRASNKFCWQIEENKDVIHIIANDDIDRFFDALGYTNEIHSRGVLAEEYIWEEYVKQPSAMLSECLQKHLLQYMLKYSASFKDKHGVECAIWIDNHARIRNASRSFCNKCRSMQFCLSASHS